MGRERGAVIVGAVVETLTVTLVTEAPGVTGLRETVQEASEGAPSQVNVIGPDIPPWPPTLRL